MYKGEFKFLINGVERGFKFGTLARAMFCELEKITPKQLGERMTGDDVMIDIDYGYYAACAYCRLNKINVDFSKDDVSCWIDELGRPEYERMVLEDFKTFIPKNVLPPIKTGDLQTNGDGKISQPSASENAG